MLWHVGIVMNSLMVSGGSLYRHSCLIEQPLILAPQRRCLECMSNFFGMLEYLTSWVWHDVGSVRTASGAVVLETALPYRIGDEGEQLPLGKFEEGCAVFHDDGAAFLYIMSLAKRDLQYRGFRDERVGSFQYKVQAGG